jgi:hypothetical protein
VVIVLEGTWPPSGMATLGGCWGSQRRWNGVSSATTVGACTSAQASTTYSGNAVVGLGASLADITNGQTAK